MPGERWGSGGNPAKVRRAGPEMLACDQRLPAKRRSRSLLDSDALPAHAENKGKEKGCSDSFQKQSIVINK